MGLDYYGILNVPRDCATHDISLAYRKYALMTHPHRKPYRLHPENPPEGCEESISHLPTLSTIQCWQYVNEAYDVLVNPLHREVFDLYGEEGLKCGTVAPMGFVQPYIYHGDYMKTYRDAFGTESPYVDLIDAITFPPPLYSSKERYGVRMKDPPIVIPLMLTLKDVFYGNVKKHTFIRQEFTDHTRTLTEPCAHTFSVPIRPGIRTGCEITFPDEGHRSQYKLPSDVIFIIEDRPDPIFERDGNDLHWTYKIDLKQALCGFVITLNTVDGRKLRIPIIPVVSPGGVKCIPDEGLPTEEDVSVKGNLYIHFKIEFPTDMRSAAKLIKCY